MSTGNKPKTADWAPGTLDHTRQNIGNISKEEAERMTQLLGGEVMYEKTQPISESHLRSRKTVGVISRSHSSSDQKHSAASHNHIDNSQADSEENSTQNKRRENLPEVSRHVNAAIDKLMMSNDFRIKQNFGLFNFIRNFQKNGTEKISPDFIENTLSAQIKNMESFITYIKTLIQIAPNTYKAKIVNELDPKFRFLRMVAEWTVHPIKVEYENLASSTEQLLTADLIPYVRTIYRPIMSIYYFGENKIPKLIKDIFTEISAYPEVDQNKLSLLAKSAISQWLYIDSEIVHKLYPLLMRMCSNVYEEYPDFFTTNISHILKFVDLKKYDLLLPEKPKAEEPNHPEPEEEKQPEPDINGKKDEVVNTGISILNQLFPDAGFDQLDRHPDFFPYFQPLYNFAEGFNMLSPKNPLQLIVVLIRILEDCFRGCRNIVFTEPDAENKSKNKSDSIMKILDEWSAYRENVFEKIYCHPLKSLVNETYSKPEFAESQFGKKYKNDLMWLLRNNFLPHYKFQQLTLERPSNESKYPPLFLRTNFARLYLTEAVKSCDKAAKTRGTVNLVQNPWEHYHFDIPNEISKRLDVLLGASNMTETTNATNANILKYSLCILAVLDWWINNPQSPALDNGDEIYRVSDKDGKPAFSTTTRSDQNKLFAESIKAAYAKKQ